jgi:cysteine desulfurase NifS
MRDSHFPINRSCNQATPGLTKAIAPDAFPVYSRYRHEPHACRLPASILEGDPYRIRGLIVHGASLLTSWPQTPRWRAALEKLELLVCIDRQLTADAAYADIVLPASTMFEISSYMTYGPLFRLRDRVIEPLGESRNDYLIMAELAARLGYGDCYPQSEEEMIRFALEGSGFALEDVQRAGGAVKLPGRMMEYRKWEKGRLRPNGAPGFDTPTGKFEIFSSVLEEHGYEPLPKYVEPSEGPRAAPHLLEEFPLVFNSGARPQTDFRSQHHGIPGLVKEHPEPTVDINVEDAAARGIAAGDLVEVRTLRGAVPFRARVSEDIVRGAVDCSQGAGGPVGPKAWREWNVNLLTDDANYDEISGFPVYKALLCEVTKIADGQGDAAGLATCDVPAFSATRREIVRRDVYLDNAATTRVADEVREEMLPFLSAEYGNPSSLHAAGREAHGAIEKARRRLASLLCTRARRILFTGGGSEANNLAIKGALGAAASAGRHVITTRIEHPSVLQTFRHLEGRGYDAMFLEVDEDGLVSPASLRDALRDDTLLVSIMLANNEVGTIQPIAELAAIARERGALFHCDAVQGVGKIPVDVDDLGVDLLSLSGHKFHGPKGVGALYVRKGVRLEPLIYGGSQERRLRAGTENVPAIAGLGRAAELAARRLARADEVRERRDLLEQGVRGLLPKARRNGHATQRLPNLLNLTLPGLRGESLVVAMDAHGIAFSSGSACKAGSPEPTHVLMAMGRSEEEAHCAVRFSLSFDTTRQDVEDTISTLEFVLSEMEATVRFLPCK